MYNLDMVVLFRVHFLIIPVYFSPTTSHLNAGVGIFKALQTSVHTQRFLLVSLFFFFLDKVAKELTKNIACLIQFCKGGYAH